jgi:arabinofuranan 3-O-arabinosyltransferase
MNRIEELLLKLLRHWLPYYLLAWLAAVVTSAVAVYYAWHCFDNTRRDGNGGHATIDFGGQYLMGRMLITGHGDDLYNRRIQREVLREVYPAEDWKRSDRKPDDSPDRGDVENMMYWIMGNDDSAQAEAAGTFLLPLGASDPLSVAATLAACDEEVWTPERRDKAKARRVGGPLYPPVNAFVAAPLALMPAPVAYRVQQLFNVLLVFVAAAGARTLARGRVWWPVLVPAIMMFPGYAGSINLGQNATLTLTILVWGWALTARGRPVLGGMVWGLLAFKPVWALAFFLVPFLSRRWRMCLAMVATGAALGLLTLPFVGFQSWFDWLSIGKEAATTYDVEKNWIFLSRDLLSVPRRWWIDFDKGYYERLDGTIFLLGKWPISVGVACFVFGWAMILFALENTVRLAVMRRRQAAAPDGPPAAFLFLGAWMCCYHFMYYDALLGAMGLFLLFTEPRRYLSPLLVVLARLRGESAGAAVAAYHRPALPEGLPPAVPLDLAPRAVWTLNRMAPTAFLLLLVIHYVFPALHWGDHWGTPWDTFTLVGVWAWCGWQWLRHGEKVATKWAGDEPVEVAFSVVHGIEEERNGEADPAGEAITTSLPGDAP